MSQSKAWHNPDSFDRKFFYDCFPTLERLTLSLNPQQNSPIILQKLLKTHVNYTATMAYDHKDGCNPLSLQAFEQATAETAEGDYGHLTAGHRYYSQLAGFPTTNKTVWVLRTEHMWEDIVTVEKALGGNPEESLGKVMGSQFSHGSETYKKSSSSVIRPADRIYVCCALWPDMEAYWAIVERAVNLSPSQKQRTYQTTWDQCGDNITNWNELKSQCDSLETTISILQEQKQIKDQQQRV